MSPANRLNQIIDEQKISKREFAKRVGVSENSCMEIKRYDKSRMSLNAHSAFSVIVCPKITHSSILRTIPVAFIYKFPFTNTL